uniref:Waxy protein n=1 Tax=Triticum aestivum subsp. sphaerococcum TaxID=77604 RepID=A0A0K0PX68_WHEAT|nr:Waxy protein [Triticum aestivum subsp. sphaerococcum]
MAALVTSQLATSGTVLGITDRFRRAGFQGVRPRSPADAPLGMRTTGASAAPKQQSRKAHRGTRRCLSMVVRATGSAGMNLVFVGAEMAPWSKTGGLGDVLGGLPPAMAANGHRVMVISPRYDQYKDAWDTSVVSEIKVADEYERVRYFHCYKRGVDRVFVDHPCFLEKVRGKTKEKIYGPDAGTDYEDNQLRFSLLCQAALEAPRILDLNNNPYFSGPYGEDVVFVCNDWHTGLLACYLKSNYQSSGIYRTAKVAFCIHNISYQGRFSFDDFAQLNLPDRFKSSFDFIDGYDKPVEGRKINWMKAGILQADKVGAHGEPLLRGGAHLRRSQGLRARQHHAPHGHHRHRQRHGRQRVGPRQGQVPRRQLRRHHRVGGEGAEQGGAAGRGGAAGGPEGAPGGLHRQAGGAEGPRRDDRRHPGDLEGGGRPDRSPGHREEEV